MITHLRDLENTEQDKYSSTICALFLVGKLRF